MTGDMVYIKTNKPTGAQGRDKYHGQVATGYDLKREASQKWRVEQAIIEDMLSGLHQGDWVTDIPIGTGRFIPYYEAKGLLYRGIDKSREMIAQAVKKVTVPRLGRFMHGDILDSAGMAQYLEPLSTDATVMCRLTRWLDGREMGSAETECRTAMANIERITRGRIIFTARVDHPRQDIIRPIEWFELPGWKIHRNEAGYEDSYRIVEMRRAS